MNEYIFSTICYFIVVFTDFIPVIEQYKKSVIIINLIVIFFLINMSFVLKVLMKAFKLFIIKFYNIAEHKANNLLHPFNPFAMKE
jgi:hypothetical protein